MSFCCSKFPTFYGVPIIHFKSLQSVGTVSKLLKMAVCWWVQFLTHQSKRFSPHAATTYSHVMYQHISEVFP